MLRRLEEARLTLIERNLRNKLVNCPLTSRRSRQIHVVDELSDEIFSGLLGGKRQYTFAAGRGVADEDSDEADSDIAGWVPPEEDSGEGVASRHRDNSLQTQLTAEGLQKRLTSLYYESREVEEEQGVNVLYLALGFIKWFESAQSDVERFAPLILLPVELTREGARDRFKLKIRDEDLYTNVSLKVWLTEQHSIQLPELPDTDDWKPSTYFAQVAPVIANEPRWEVLPDEILLGFFSFNKFLLWRDLDPKNWPTKDSLLNHGVLKRLLVPAEEAPLPEPPVIPPDARVDKFFKLSELQYVLDADSSQTSAIQSALAGRNLVIQGPPGTGKSQTIANVIAAAIGKGKSVLFVAEKLAALQVVFDRLKAVGLGHLCFELHSRKASKQLVLQQLKQAMETPTPPKVPVELGSSLDGLADSLWQHSDRLHKQLEPSGLTPYEVMGRICCLKDHGVGLPDFKVRGAEQASKSEIRQIVDRGASLGERMRISGVPARHPWRACERAPLSPLDQQRLSESIGKLSALLDGLTLVVRSIWPKVCRTEGTDFRELKFDDLELIAQALEVAAKKPGESIDILCHARWSTDLGALDGFVATATDISRIETALNSIFTPGAWSSDWSAVRTEIAGSGNSIFRVFRGPYREAVRTLRGSCKSFPSTTRDRVAALDSLIEGIELKRRLSAQAADLRGVLGVVVDQLPSDLPRASALTDWLHRATALEKTLSVRNPRLLGWSEAPLIWAERLRSMSKRAHEALLGVAAFVQLKVAENPPEERRLDWSLGKVLERVSAWKVGGERYNEWPPVRDALRWLQAKTEGDFAKRCYSGAVPPQEVSDRIQLAIYEQIWGLMASQDPELARADGRMLNDTAGRFRSLDRTRVKAAAVEVAKKHHEDKPTGTVGHMAIIRAELNKSRKHLPVRKLMERAGHAVQQLKPAFLMSPLSIAQYLPPGQAKFDLLLIDEASQVRPGDALGAVARATQVVVVGDAKQLPPTNFFNRLVADEDEIDTSADGATTDVSTPLGSMESILSLCDATFTSREMLAWHYRSQHPALIAVSNRNFYDNKLLLPPSVIVERAADGFGVMFHRTPAGGYDRGRSATNILEADLVADAVCKFARDNPKKSLGVGTFSVAQRDAIRDRIDLRRRQYPDLEPFFATSRDSPFFVKNLESIQGDERDVIFISVGYGRDKDGRLTQNFGPINADGGERRLNVLISRARERCEVFSPITADDIDVSNRKPGIVALREFLQYAEKGYFDVPQRNEKTFDSDFEESVAQFLRSRGFVVHPQVGMAGFYIDLGVIDAAKPSRYLLGIECDGATYHSSRSARDRDRIRQEILESRGWTIHRIWSTDWFHRRSQEESKILDALTRASSKPDSRVSSRSPEVLQMEGEQEELALSGSRKQGYDRIEPYEEARFRVKSDQAPHEAPEAVVRDTVLRIVGIEEPVHEDEVCRRLATVWGLERAGSRIQEVGLRALASLKKAGTCDSSDKFWYSNPRKEIRVRDRSETPNVNLRKAEYLPPGEIQMAAADVVRESVRVHVDDLVAATARRFGFLRTGPDLMLAIRSAIVDAEGTLLDRDEAGFYSVRRIDK